MFSSKNRPVLYLAFWGSSVSSLFGVVKNVQVICQIIHGCNIKIIEQIKCKYVAIHNTKEPVKNLFMLFARMNRALLPEEK